MLDPVPGTEPTQFRSDDDWANKIVPSKHKVPVNRKQYRRMLCRGLQDRTLNQLAEIVQKPVQWIIDYLNEEP